MVHARSPKVSGYNNTGNPANESPAAKIDKS